MNIFAGNLNFQTTEDQLKEVFTPFGEVASVKIITDKFSGRSRGFAFIEIPDPTQAEKAIQELQNYPLNNRNMVVSKANQRDDSKRYNK